MSNSARSLNPATVAAVDKRPHYVGVTPLSVFGGNFILAKVRRGRISVRCSELRGVRFSEPSAVQRLSAFRRVRY